MDPIPDGYHAQIPGRVISGRGIIHNQARVEVEVLTTSPCGRYCTIKVPNRKAGSLRQVMRKDLTPMKREELTPTPQNNFTSVRWI